MRLKPVLIARALLILALLAASGAALAPAARAALITVGFTYYNQDTPNPPVVQGVLTLDDSLVPGGFVIVGMSGQRDGVPITSVIPPGDPVFFNDNRFFFTSPHLDSFGMAFTVEAGVVGVLADDLRVNLFNNANPQNCGQHANDYAESLDGQCSNILAVAFEVPEPPVLLLFGAALLAFGLLPRRARLPVRHR